jgi:hypothetical protein
LLHNASTYPLTSFAHPLCSYDGVHVDDKNLFRQRVIALWLSDVTGKVERATSLVLKVVLQLQLPFAILAVVAPASFIHLSSHPTA